MSDKIYSAMLSSAASVSSSSGGGGLKRSGADIYAVTTKRRKVDSNYENQFSTDRPQNELGMVTARLQIDIGMGVHRQENTSKISDASKRIGGVFDIEILDIQPGEAMFIETNNPKAGAFTAFNGLGIERFANQYDFEQAFKFIGNAKIPQLATDGKRPVGHQHTGATAVIRGLQAFYNTGKRDVEIADLFIITPPKMDPTERGIELASSLCPRGIPNGKMVGVLRTLSDVLTEFSDDAAYAAHWNNLSAGNNKANTLAATSNKILNPLERYAAVTFQYLPIINGLELIAVLSDLGIVSVNLPETIDASTRTKLNELLKTPMESLSKTNNQTSSTLVPGAPWTDAEKSARNRRYSNLCMLLGAVQSPLESIELVKKVYQQVGDLTPQSTWARMTRVDGSGYPPLQAKSQTVGNLMEIERYNRASIQRSANRALEDAVVPSGRVIMAAEHGCRGGRFSALL